MSQADPLAVQIAGDHYKKLAIQPMVYATANRYDPCAFSILKYVTRWRDKGGVQDLKKALHIAQMRQAPEIEQHLSGNHSKNEISIFKYTSQNKIPKAERAILEWLDIWVFGYGYVAKREAGAMVVGGLASLIAEQEGVQHG